MNLCMWTVCVSSSVEIKGYVYTSPLVEIERFQSIKSVRRGQPAGSSWIEGPESDLISIDAAPNLEIGVRKPPSYGLGPSVRKRRWLSERSGLVRRRDLLFELLCIIIAASPG